MYASNFWALCKNILLIFLLHFVTACSKQPIKTEVGQKETTSVSFLSKIENKNPAPFYIFPVDEHLWAFYPDRIVVHSKYEKKIHFFKEDKTVPCIQKSSPKCDICVSNLEGHTDCIPRLELYGKNYVRPIKRLNQPRGIDSKNNEVRVRFSSMNKTFTKNGTYLGNEKIDWKKPYIPKLPKGQKLIGFREDPQRGNIPFFRAKSGHELFPIGNFFFSGDWLLMYFRMKNFGNDPKTFKYENTRILVVYQPTGEIVKTIQSYEGKYRVREYGTGFYVDKLVNGDIKPYLWFGKAIWELESKDSFCYVFNESRKCVRNHGTSIRAIIHNNYFRATIAGRGKDKKLYMEWK